MTAPTQNPPENVPSSVVDFYEGEGWAVRDGVTEDARRYEDLRDCAREYVRQCRLRVLRHIPPSGAKLLDVGSGPIQYDEYLRYSENYQVRTCVDLSQQALDAARKKIGDRGEFHCGSFLDVALEPNSFDCAISLHTIYHMPRDRQEDAVRKLLDVVRPGSPVLIVYTNPGALTGILAGPLRTARTFLRRGGGDELYVYAHPNHWWRRFEDVADLQILPWRSLPTPYQKLLVPNNALGSKLLKQLFDLEDRFPKFFARYLQYPMIILKKKVISAD